MPGSGTPAKEYDVVVVTVVPAVTETSTETIVPIRAAASVKVKTVVLPSPKPLTLVGAPPHTAVPKALPKIGTHVNDPAPVDVTFAKVPPRFVCDRPVVVIVASCPGTTTTSVMAEKVGNVNIPAEIVCVAASSVMSPDPTMGAPSIVAEASIDESTPIESS